MPAIRFRNFALVGGSAIGLTDYSAVYTPNTFIDGNLYIVARGQGNPSSVDFIQADIINLSQMRFSRNTGVGNNVSITYIIPIPLINPNVNGLPQYAQARIISKSTNVGMVLGPAVLLSGDLATGAEGSAGGANGYMIATNSGDDTTFLLRRAGQNGNTLDTIVGWALNDLARIEVVPSVPAGSYNLKVFRNGVQVNTGTPNAINDAGATRPFAGIGYPGFKINNIPIPAATNAVWDQQRWGIL